MSNARLLVLRNLVKDYPKPRGSDAQLPAVNGVSLEIGAGDFVALVGPSGSGKTTLLNLAAGLDQVSSGQVELADQKISEMSNAALSYFRARNIGFVFQAHNLFPVLTALENAEYTSLIRGDDRADARRRAIIALDKVGLAQKHHSYPNQLSGGQQQRVAVARALASDPKIIFADEPTASLDSHTAFEMIDLFQELNEKDGVTFVFATHDTRLIDRAKTLIQIRDGRLDAIVHQTQGAKNYETHADRSL
jgi:putative ABC transport system ATP-binding protein